MRGTGVTMGQLATAFSQAPSVGGRRVDDRTGLTGKYHIQLEYTPSVIPGPNGNTSPNPAADSGPSVFTAAQEQLGLKLQAVFFFIDSPATEIYTLSLHDALPI